MTKMIAINLEMSMNIHNNMCLVGKFSFDACVVAHTKH